MEDRVKHSIISITVIMMGLISQLVFPAETRVLLITQQFLNLPVSNEVPKVRLQIKNNGELFRVFDIQLAERDPQYWVFVDVSGLKGESISVSLKNYEQKHKGMAEIYQADHIAGEDSLYHEKLRPQFHFTSKRGWNNDPNGLVYHEGEYHLFYQHNPYGTKWGNMHWGHAVSPDLIHWVELGDALFAQEKYTIFSGSAVIDHHNSSGFQRGKEKVMVAAYTAHWDDRKSNSFQDQHIAYSTDRGRTWKMYENNPVIGIQEEKWNTRYNRDPKIFWYKPDAHWVMALYEQIGISIYSSDNLKDWVYQSHVEGFYECPELFELPVDGDPTNTKWIMYSGAGSYAIGEFDGKNFNWESGKHWYTDGALYAAQTFNNIPASNGRRIQIGWGRIESPGMPFNQLMLFPTEFTLRTTSRGLRLYCEPVEEIEQLHTKKYQWQNLFLDELNDKLKDFNGELLHIKCELETVDSQKFGMIVHGNKLVYDIGGGNLFNGFPYSLAANSKSLYMEVLVDRTSIETFLDHGAFCSVMAKDLKSDNKGIQFWSVGRTPTIFIKNLEVYELKSIWE
jgi:sucrose-6-phosphate hydrolase SacC (GH32 family)